MKILSAVGVWLAFVAAVALVVASCQTMGPGEGPGEGEIMGYPGKPDANGTLVCSSESANRYPERQGASDAKCYKPEAFKRWCEKNQIYVDEGQCAEVLGGRK